MEVCHRLLIHLIAKLPFSQFTRTALKFGPIIKKRAAPSSGATRFRIY
ncbi:hypothetical protein TR2A62_3622 [Thalassobium sp. R2A62]|nr:hypothetical protein TR2A62_3622 [Thalassobium sp. R2A62]